MIRRADIAASCRITARRLDGQGEASPVELAIGIVHHVAAVSPAQAEALAACWWPGWDVPTLAALLAAGRHAAIAEYYREPRRGRQGYAAAARALHKSPSNVAEAVARGVETLHGWLAQRAALVTVSATPLGRALGPNEPL